ncbi:MAG: diguanylate cyclase [Actinomycetota bacterium]|nr:diguanylate cyclase [Actinomycetota bacterium]
MDFDRADVRTRLSSTASIAAAAQVVCEALREHGYHLVSVYLCRSDRLRCFAAIGYSQVLDGFPSVSGVIAATVRTGQPHVVEVAQSEIYLKAAPSVVAEVCVPIAVDGTVVGALNIESQSPLADDTAHVAAEYASMFAQRLTELGGLPEPTGWMYLADQATRIVQIEDDERLFTEALDIAAQLSGAESGMVAVGDSRTGFSVVAVKGDLGEELMRLPSETLNEIGGWVDGPKACYTLGDTGGETFAGFERLRDAGLGLLLVIALERGSEQLGFLVVADRTSATPSAELVEQLELLGSLVSSALSNARHLALLRDLARRDPLTGLGHHVAFGERLLSVRKVDGMCAVLAIDVDHFKTVNDTFGHEHGDRVLRELADAMSTAIRCDDALFRIGGDEFAAVVAVSSREEAVAVAGRMEEAARRVGTPVSIGVALDEGGEVDDLYARADAALYRAKHAGRNLTVIASASDGRHGANGRYSAAP